LGLEATGHFQTTCFVENEPYCQAVLKHHWPDIPVLGDIRNVRREELPDPSPGLICGGFPCQPFSNAGKQRAQDDPRHLWPEMFRLIRECRPTWVVGENVAGLINLGLDEILDGMASEGYATRTFNLPACAVGAPHLRQRLWIVAHSDSESEPDKSLDGSERDGQLGFGFMADTKRKGKGRRRLPRPGKDKSENGQGPSDKFRGCREAVANPNSNDGGRECGSKPPNGGTRLEHSGRGERSRPEEWWEVEPSVGRVVDGLPNRVPQLRALGNAIVPQIAKEIGEAIHAAEIEDPKTHGDPQA
jgi:DNA (cytosine-5)-methyltransferase 1